MWHEGVRCALLRLRLFRAVRFVNVARAVQTLSRHCYTAANTAYVTDKLNVSWERVGRITHRLCTKVGDDGMRTPVLLASPPPCSKGKSYFTRDFLRFLGITNRRRIFAPAPLKTHHAVEAVRSRMREITGARSRRDRTKRETGHIQLYTFVH